GLEFVLYDGSVVRVGGKSPDSPGLDLTGLMVGSEGTLAVVTEATVKLLPLPEAVRTTLALFESVEAASGAVSELIGRGVVPSALEMMDKLALSAIEAAFHAGYRPAIRSADRQPVSCRRRQPAPDDPVRCSAAWHS